MKSHSQALTAACLALAILTSAHASARTWTSADGKGTIEGNLIGYDANSGEVTLERDGKRFTFNQEILSADDIAFLNQKGSATPIADSAPVKSSGTFLPPDYLTKATDRSGFKDKGGYYKAPPFFNPYPEANDKKGWLIRNFGPVGIGINLKAPGMTMEIANVEAGSPAEKAGKLKAGQIIESINGVKMDGRDPRLILGKLITDAEASDGRIDLQIKGLGQVAVTIPVMGSYSSTWPLDCKKSDRIVRNLAELIAQKGEDEWGSVLFLLSTGEEKDLDVVRGWMKERKEIGTMNWAIGYRGLGVCEYYLRTGDSSVLPMIQQAADHLRDNIYNGGWAGRSGSFGYQAGGHLNAAGVHCLTFLLLAKTCGVAVDDATLASSLRHFYRYSGRGSVPYGDYTPKAGFTDCNGKTSGLAVAMAAASRLTPGGEDSVYSRAAEINAMKSFYGTNVFTVGHTGGGIGEIWKSASMGLLAGKRAKQYRSYMDARWWTLEISRRHHGGIGVGGGAEGNYDKATGEENKGISWGTYHALSYTLPRKHLHLSGAPLSKWAKPFTLPERPWGTAADDVFSSPLPVPGGPWSPEDTLAEVPEQHAGQAVLELLGGSDVSDRDILTYLHHPELTFRSYAVDTMLKLKKDDMLLSLLKSEDARLRHMGVMALHELFGTWRKDQKDPGRVTPAMMDLVEKMIRDPQESWFVKQWALGILQHVDIERLRTFKELLVTLIGHEEHWIQGSAISASQPLLSDPESYKTLFPPIVKAISEATAYSIVTRAHEITEGLDAASPEIQQYALDMLKPVYKSLPNELVSERGIYVIPDGGPIKRSSMGKVIGFSEEGQFFLDIMPKVTSAWKVSGKDEDLFVFDGKFAPNPDFHGTWGLIDHTLPKTKEEAIAFIRKQLEKNKVPSPETNKINYGFTVEGDGKVTPLRFSGSAYDKPLRYSGKMVFSTFIDKAYHFEILSVDGRQYLMLENVFEAERDESYEPAYKVYAKLKD